MSIYIFLFFLLSLSTAQDDCSTPKNCSDHGPPIRFPFRLKNHHPQHCGYLGFDLSCSPNNTATVLDLPNSVKVIVTNINYTSQSIHIKDPKSCFPRQLQNLDLSTTPFQFADTVYSFSLFSCPSTKSDFSYRVTCLDGDGREVYAEHGEWLVNYPYDDLPPMLSCRKMYNLWANKAFDQADLQLKWHQRVEGHGLEIACVTLGSFLLLVILIAMYWFYRQKKIKRKDHLKIERFLEDYRALKPARYSYADIKKITNQFKDKVGQGGYGTVYRGQLSNDVYVAVKGPFQNQNKYLFFVE